MVENAMAPFQYKCAKCDGLRFSVHEMRGPSGGFIAFMDIDDVQISLVTCENCRYAEIYQMSRKEFLQSRGLSD
jgi:predicted nucleic-acid-binding Zn-ribbon protein